MTSENNTINGTQCLNCFNATNANTELQSPLNVHGGFIAMAAGLSVVIPLVCVLIIQLRRARREEHERRLRLGRGDQESGTGTDSVTDPPPTYEELFGPGYEPNLHRQDTRNGSTDNLVIDENEVEEQGEEGGGGGGGQINPLLQRHSRDSDSGNDSGDGGDPQGSPRVVSPVSIISGNDVRDAVLLGGGSINNAFTSDRVGGVSSASTSSIVVSLDVNRLEYENQHPYPHPPSSSLPPPPPPPPPTSSSSPSSPSQSSSTSITTNSSSPPPPSSSPPIDSPPPPSPPSSPPPPPSSPPPPQTQRVFPGMHISIQEFFSALRGQSEREAPPPTYEEALKILEKAEKAKEKRKKH